MQLISAGAYPSPGVSLPWMGCWSIAGYLPSCYWYPILLGGEKQVGLSVLLKDTEKQMVTQQYQTRDLLYRSPALLPLHHHSPHT